MSDYKTITITEIILQGSTAHVIDVSEFIPRIARAAPFWETHRATASTSVRTPDVASTPTTINATIPAQELLECLFIYQAKKNALNFSLTSWFPCYQSGNFATLNPDCESSR